MKTFLLLPSKVQWSVVGKRNSLDNKRLRSEESENAVPIGRNFKNLGFFSNQILAIAMRVDYNHFSFTGSETNRPVPAWTSPKSANNTRRC
jgi:hypothetical protein